MKSERIIYIGIPKGALNSKKENKGYTKKLLELAGWKLEGYEPGEEEPYPLITSGDNRIRFVCMRPRSLFDYLEEGLLDLALIGEDIFLERWIGHYNALGEAFFQENSKNEESKIISPSQMPLRESTKFKGDPLILNLGYGAVNLSFAVRREVYEFFLDKCLIHSGTLLNLSLVKKHFGKCPLICATEYPHLAKKVLQDYYPSNELVIQNSFNVSSSQSGVIIVPRNGSEFLVSSGLVDLAFETVSSGKHLEQYRLLPLEKPIVKSQCNLYRSAFCMSAENIRSHLSFLHDDFCYCDSQHLVNKARCNVLKRLESSEEWLNSTICEVIDRLKFASLEYGKTRQDSLYYPWRKP